MARLLKCYGEKCISENKKHLKEELIEKGKKRYCPKCLKEREKELEERYRLYEKIGELYKVDMREFKCVTTQYLMTQVKRLKEKGCTYAGMLLTLEYIDRNESGIKFNTQYGVNIIMAFYDKAKDEYIKNANRNKIQRQKAEEMDRTVKVVEVIPSIAVNVLKIKMQKESEKTQKWLEEKIESAKDQKIEKYNYLDIENSRF